jgi:hypothetical protein
MIVALDNTPKLPEMLGAFDLLEMASEVLK